MPKPSGKLRDLTAEEKSRYVEYNYVKYEEYLAGNSSVIGRFWTQKQLDRINSGCKKSTYMAESIAETYARDPQFYSGAFCCYCRAHFPNEEFVWAGIIERVGS
jgi:hypothetical protein